MSTHDFVVMNSKMPSEAAMRTRSEWSMTCSSISGSATTPRDSARESPMDRVKAVPGYSWSWAQMRGGSPPSSISSPSLQSQFSWMGSTPSIWSAVMTRAPYFLTRSLSSRRYGVWSVDSARVTTDPSGATDPSIARESPTLDTTHRRPSTYTVMAVVPDCWSSIGLCASISFAFKCAVVSACRSKGTASSSSSGDDTPAFIAATNCFDTCSRANCEHFSPTGPCPSYTENQCFPGPSKSTCTVYASWFALSAWLG
mmetsp:Transcript_29396/g.94825  ORF Transcript_29396/g.94825 Transcript_29396/m.94825 type:complete len:256 (-) Transcript_29396:453-1220(-)